MSAILVRQFSPSTLNAILIEDTLNPPPPIIVPTEMLKSGGALEVMVKEGWKMLVSPLNGGFQFLGVIMGLSSLECYAAPCLESTDG